jgi:hypothetical protein
MWFEVGYEERKQYSIVFEFGFLVGNGYGWNISLGTRWCPTGKGAELGFGSFPGYRW